MTDRAPDRPRATVERADPAPAGPGRPAASRAVGKKPGFMPTVLLGLASFAVLFEFLAFQLSSGNDPALGTSALAINDPKAARAARPVIHRRIVKTRIVHLPPKSTGPGSDPPAVTSVPTTSPPAPAPAPVTSSS